jgi:hypothetical protein
MQFQVPQFIEVEDKIFGNFTFKQFIYMAGSAGLAFLVYALIGNFFISIFFIIPILGFGAALTFYKVNNKPFILILESAFKYFLSGKLYIWRKEERAVIQAKTETSEEAQDSAGFYVPKLSDSKLKDLTWSLDIKQSQNPVTGSNGRKNI